MSRKVTLKNIASDTVSFDHAEKDNTSAESHNAAFRFEINLFELARMIFDRRRLVVVFSLSVMIITAGYLLLQPNLFKSTATILPSGESGGLSNLTSLVGLSDPFAQPDENSSILFPVVLNSNLIVDAVLDKEYSFVHRGQPMTTTLADFFGIENRDRLRTALRGITSISAENQTGQINVGVETKYPALSQAILQNYLTQLEDFNRNKRRSSARDNETYLARQLAALNEEMQDAEDRLEAFQMANIDWATTGSPEILKELGRLQRQVESKSATYTLLTQQYEMAKLEAQKDIPIVRILDQPSLPVMKSGPFRRNLILLSGVLSFMLVVMFLIVRHLMGQLATYEHNDDYRAFRNDLEHVFPRTRATINRLKTSVLEKTPFIHS